MSAFNPKIRISKDPDFKQVYATGLQDSHTPFDFRLAFHNESINWEGTTPGERLIIDRKI